MYVCMYVYIYIYAYIYIYIDTHIVYYVILYHIVSYQAIPVPLAPELRVGALELLDLGLQLLLGGTII